MSGKEKIEKDYKEFEAAITQMAQEELDRIQQKAAAVKSEADRIGEAVDKALKQSTPKKKS